MTDVYKVGVSLVMTGNFAQVLGALSQNLLGISKQVDQLQGKFTGLKLAITGALGAYAGTKVLETMGTMVKYGDQLVHQQNLLAAAGATQQQVAEATRKAYETSARVQTSTLAENVQHLKELRYAFGDMDKAQSSLEVVTKAQAVMKAATGHGYGDQIWDIVKSLEMTNKTLDPEIFSQYVDMMTQVVTATGGKVTPQQYFQAFKYGRTASQGWDAGFIGGALPRLIQSMGGGTGGGGGRAGPGNALMSAYQEIVQGQIPPKAQKFWDAMGLTGAARNPMLFTQNPYEWVQQVLAPALSRKGVIMPNMSEEDIKKLYSSDESYESTKQRTDALGVISRLLPNRTSSQAIAEMLLQGRFLMGENSQFEKDIRLQKGSMGIGAFDFLMDHDLQTNMQAFTAQWTSLMEALGSAMVPNAISVLKSLTGAFTWATQLAGVHPDTVRQVAEALGALAAGLVVFGGAAILAALVSIGGLPALIAGVVTALGTLVVINWDSITSGIRKFAWVMNHPLEAAERLATGGYFGDIGKGRHDFITGLHNGIFEKQTTAIDKNTKALDDLTNQLQMKSYMPMGYSGPGFGGGGGLINAAYTTMGGEYNGAAPFRGGGGYSIGGGVASEPSFGGVASSVGSGGIPHFSLGNIHNAVTGRVASNPALGRIPNSGASPMGNIPSFVPSGATGNAWIAAQRAGFAKELQDPQLRLLAGAMIHSEDPEAGPAALESAMNRALYGHKTLRQTLTGAFYGPMRNGAIRSHIAALQRNPALRAKMYSFIDQALAGSNVVKGHSDQGGPGDPNYISELHRSHVMFGHEVYGDWPKFEAAQRAFQEHALKSPPVNNIGVAQRNPAFSAWQWKHNNFFGDHNDHSPVPPPHDGHEVHVHSTTMLDGRTVAKNTMKHMVKMGSGRVSGARLTDHSGTRPAEV